LVKREIEMAFYGVDRGDLKRQLLKLGAKPAGTFHMKRVNFQISSRGRAGSGSYRTSWMRIRTDGKRTTLMLKEQRGRDSAGRKELEVEISKFRDTVRMIGRVMPNASPDYFENDREVYALGSLRFCIDKFPMLPYLFEIEGPTRSAVEAIAKKLVIGGEPDRKKSVPTREYYRMHGVNYALVQKGYANALKDLFED
jgi:adenylate cyclase class IV